MIGCQSAAERQQQLIVLAVGVGIRAAGDRRPVPCSHDTDCKSESTPVLLHAAYSAHVACMQHLW